MHHIVQQQRNLVTMRMESQVPLPTIMRPSFLSVRAVIFVNRGSLPSRNERRNEDDPQGQGTEKASPVSSNPFSIVLRRT